MHEGVAVYRADTKEILAYIPLVTGEDGFVKDGIEFKLYPKGTEPVFVDMGNGLITLKDNVTIYNNLL
jgi:hypothetical protein